MIYLNFDYLNEMIHYIEENLDNDIDFNKLSKITNTNLFILERIFMFLTNMTLVEYIKRRRLSKAFEEIRNTNHKIIDIAVKYHYNSATSFNRAFKRLFNITPTECRMGHGSYKTIPIQYFECNKNKYEFDYETKDLGEKVIYCYSVSSTNYAEFLYKIKELYKKVRKNKRYEEFNKNGMYGIFLGINHKFQYFLGSQKEYPDLEKFKIKKGKYAVFTLSSREQENIVELENRINKQWIFSTDYHVQDNLKIEYYEGDTCYILLKFE